MKKTIKIAINVLLTLIVSSDLLSQNNLITPRAAIFQKYFTLGSDASEYVVLGKHNGTIVSIKTSKFYIKSHEGKIVRGAYCFNGLSSTMIIKQLFDRYGRQLENLKLDSLNNLIEGDYFQYDSRGYLKKRRTFTKYKYEYAFEGRKLKLINNDMSTTFLYNDAGILYVTNDFDIDDRVLCKKVFHYNDEFELIDDVTLCLRDNDNPKTKFRMKRIFKQVGSNHFTLKNIKDGYVIKQKYSFYLDRDPDWDTITIPDSSLHHEVLFRELVVDTVTNLITETYFDSDGEIAYKAKIDSLGRGIWKQVNTSVHMKSYEFYNTSYNDHNDEIKLTYLDENGKPLNFGVKTFDYKYDENGNWITKTERVDNVPTYLYIREIQYAK